MRTDDGQPDVPVLDDAWDAADAEAHPMGIRQSLADALMEPTTQLATIVEIEVPDGALLEQLRRPRPGVAAAVAPSEPPAPVTGDGCVFCAIVGGGAPATVVRSWPDAVAVRPLNPVVDGHVIVLPRGHVADAATDPAVTAAVMHRAAELLAEMPAANVITSRGAAATQTVFHLHVHVVPRDEDDGLPLPWTSQQAASA